MTRLSHIPSEAQLQRQMLAMIGWLILAVLVVGAFAIAHTGAGRSIEDDPPAGLLPARIGLGVVFGLLSLRLPVLVRRNAPDLARVAGLKRQYVTGAVVTTVLGTVFIFFWWPGLLATAAGLLALVLAARVRTIPVEQMAEQVDYDDPEAWRATGPLADRPNLRFALAILVGILLGMVTIAAVAVLVDPST